MPFKILNSSSNIYWNSKGSLYYTNESDKI